MCNCEADIPNNFKVNSTDYGKNRASVNNNKEYEKKLATIKEQQQRMLLQIHLNNRNR